MGYAGDVQAKAVKWCILAQVWQGGLPNANNHVSTVQMVPILLILESIAGRIFSFPFCYTTLQFYPSWITTHLFNLVLFIFFVNIKVNGMWLTIVWH